MSIITPCIFGVHLFSGISKVEAHLINAVCTIHQPQSTTLIILSIITLCIFGGHLYSGKDAFYFELKKFRRFLIHETIFQEYSKVEAHLINAVCTIHQPQSTTLIILSIITLCIFGGHLFSGKDTFNTLNQDSQTFSDS
ncbi:hypothetical protein BC943DRAFT_333370 [Umbelopsis sp. AD052]|nr:hypothetical protein BC943DRAFT_333370 [Umbelopsis sp. AD052]